jgi:hypothetical protein
MRYIALLQRLTALAAALTLIVVSPGCPDTPGSEPDGGDAALDAGDAGSPEAGLDAGPEAGTCVPTPGTDATPGVVHQLPPTGENEVISVYNHGRYVTYSEIRNPEVMRWNYEVFLYDLENRQEIQITDDTITVQWDAYLWGDEITWSDRGSGIDGSIVHLYDIPTGTATVLMPADGIKKAYFQFNDDHFLYLSKEGVPPETEGYSVYLKDRHTLEKTLLCPYTAHPETFWMGERYPTWVARPAQGGNGTKDVFYYDVDARQVVRLESTEPGHQYYPIHAGDYIYWEDDRDGDWNIYRYDLVAGMEERFTWDEQDQGNPRVRGHLLTWVDYRWSCGTYWGGSSPGDVVLFDTETHVMRRVTTDSRLWSNLFVHGRWTVYSKKVGYRRSQIFSHDLVSDGLLDGPDGHVIPGPGEPLVP